MTAPASIRSGDWIQIRILFEEKDDDTFVLESPHHDPTAASPSTNPPVRLTRREGEDQALTAITFHLDEEKQHQQKTLLQSGDVVTVGLAGPPSLWAAASRNRDGCKTSPTITLVWSSISEDSTQTTISPFRFIVMRPPSSSDNEDEAAEGDGGQLRVGQSLVLVPCIPGSPTADAHLVALAPQEGGDDDALQVGIGVCAEEEQDKQQQALTKNIVLIIDAVVDSSSSSASSPQAHTPLPPPQDEEKQQPPDDTTSAALSTQDQDTGGEAAALMDLPLTAREVVVIFEEGELGVTIKRTPSGQAHILRIISGTQAMASGIQEGDLIREVNGLDLRNTVLDSKSWAAMIEHMKRSERPLSMTVAREPLVGAGGGGGGGAQGRKPLDADLAYLERKLDFTSARQRNSVSGDSFCLNDGTRALLHQGQLKIWSEGRMWNSLQLREALLFTDTLVLALPPTTSGGTAEVDVIIALATCKLREIGRCDVIDPKAETFSFGIVTPSGVYTLCSSSANERRAWVNLIYAAAVAALQIKSSSSTGLRHQLVIDTLHSAVLHGHLNEARDILAQKGAAAANEHDDEGRTPLHYSCMVRQHNLLSLLLSHGADQTIADHHGRRALHLSALALDDAAIALLLSSHNAKSMIDARDEQGRTPAFLAAVHGRMPSVERNVFALRRSLNALLAYEADLDARPTYLPTYLPTSIHNRMPSGERNVFALQRSLNALLAYEADLDAYDNTGRIALHHLASTLQYAAAEVLVDLGSDVNAFSIDDISGTPLHWVCVSSASSSHLLPNNSKNKASTAAAEEAEKGHPLPTTSSNKATESVELTPLSASLELLLKHGGQPNLRDGKSGNTPLHLLLENLNLNHGEKVAAVSTLLSFGARTDIGNDAGVTCNQIVGQMKDEGEEGKAAKFSFEATSIQAKASWSSSKAPTKLEEGILSKLMGKAKNRPNVMLWLEGGEKKHEANKTVCDLCGEGFSALTRRQHHCRLCGQAVCGSCSSKKVVLGTSYLDGGDSSGAAATSSSNGGGSLSSSGLKLLPGSSSSSKESSSTTASRVCDGCFNWACHQLAVLSLAAASAPSTKGTKSAAEEAYEADQRELGLQQQEGSSSNRSLGTRAMNWLMGGDADSEQQRRRGGGGGVTRQTTKQANMLGQEMEQLQRGLQDRGERLNNLADRTADLADSSSQFAAMARQLNEQSKNPWSSLW